MCHSVDPLLTVDADTTQSTEYEHVCVVVDQVVHTCLGHEGAREGGDDDCRGGGDVLVGYGVVLSVCSVDGQCDSE